MFCYNRANNAVTNMGGCFDGCMARDCMQNQEYLKDIQRNYSEIDSFQYDTASQGDSVNSSQSEEDHESEVYVTFGGSSYENRLRRRRGDFIYRSTKVKLPMSSYNLDGNDEDDQTTLKRESSEQLSEESFTKEKGLMKMHTKTQSLKDNTLSDFIQIDQPQDYQQPQIQKSKSTEPVIQSQLIPVIEENELKSFNSATDQWICNSQDDVEKLSIGEFDVDLKQNEDEYDIEIPPPLSDQPKIFQSKRFIGLLKVVLKGAQQEQMDIDHYTGVYFESLKLFKFFGTALELGFKDISDKANTVLTNRKLIQKHEQLTDEALETKYFESLLKYEVQNKLAKMYMGNNKSVIKNQEIRKEDVKNWMYSYSSVCFVALTGSWFFEFMAEILRLLVADRKMVITKVAHTAYENTLSHHHPWILRKVIKVGINIISSRESFINGYIAEIKVVLGDNCDVREDSIYEELFEFHKLVKKLSEHLSSLCKKNGVDQIA